MIFNCIPPVDSGGGGLCFESGSYVGQDGTSGQPIAASLTLSGTPRLLVVYSAAYRDTSNGNRLFWTFQSGNKFYGYNMLTLLPNEGIGYSGSTVADERGNSFYGVVFNVSVSGNTVTWTPETTGLESSIGRDICCNNQGNTYYYFALVEKQ